MVGIHLNIYIRKKVYCVEWYTQRPKRFPLKLKMSIC